MSKQTITSMSIVSATLAFCLSIVGATAGQGEVNGKLQTAKPLQVRLGYPAEAKLLVLNADDLALAHSEDVASFTALERKWITSGTVMVPCPWFTEVTAYAKAHPEADLGLHLTLTSEWDTYRWGPVASRGLVSSLIAPDGNFYADRAGFVEHAKPEEVEIELRAQIDRAKSMGLEPSHLDAHMHVLYATPELFGVFLKVAQAYKLPIRMARNDALFQPRIAQMGPNDPIPAIFSPGADVPAAGWVDYYVNLVKNLQPGVTEVFCHLANDDAESQAIMVNHADWGAAWRQREFDALSSPKFRQALVDNHVTLVGWREIKKLL
jgi:chitin disaccharide deacetylase